MPPTVAAARPRAARTWPERLFGRWWRRQSAAHQDRYATLGPLFSVLLFLAAIISAFWYLRNEEFEREQEAVKRDTEISQQQLRLRLIENQEQLVRMARDIVTRGIERQNFAAHTSSFVRDRPEITNLIWVGADRSRIAGHAVTTFLPESGVTSDDTPASMPALRSNAEPERTFVRGRESRQTTYSGPFADSYGHTVFQVQVPLFERSTFAGALIAEYSVERLVRYYVPSEVSSRHAISLLDRQGRALASTVMTPAGSPPRRGAINHEVPLAPAHNGLVLRGQGHRTSIGLISNTLFWMVAALSVLTVWMLLGTGRHMRRRLQMQAALVSETNFRRAMENSMLTGMRAMDLEGRITYVNPAFCAMTGFSDADLIGQRPPFPHWPRDRVDENRRLLEQELQGKSPAGGIEVKVMRKDGTIFDARMYVSPLIDPKGQQTGWMTSMTNITEAKRIRDQLTASHERFTTVLEGLDAAVSVVSVQQGELLFANRSYRLWFGAVAAGHALLSGGQASSSGAAPVGEAIDESVDDLGGLPTQELTDAGSDSREVFVESLQKWFDVRARYLQWTDGRLAQMLIATDITERRHAEAVAASQAEKAQVTSRLVTMGEMASSVAHELNQPLTAITNYCNGMVTRVENNAIDKGDLVAALQKTARQAERAGQIIHRIRAFVKRSEPQRQRAYAHTIVEDAVELAGIELRRRNVAIHTYVAQRPPPLMVDPILIEQVVLNLLKNAAEAIDNAHLPTARRRIELRVLPRHSEEEGDTIEFIVTDHGPGLKEEVLARLYEAFFSTKVDGLGIGLSLCRSIIESHRGRIKATNLYNGETPIGCRFSFTLPVETSRSDAPAAATA
ncbi:PAS domain S-box protein [Piscinibacter koreensis]|uniref:histidine kinase n=1 Tax=Piscinibacter koreensis TaxID=2742824 RepID=A0A7Y6NKU2_9BURK|nr:PAS domain S-box protein [Schlegelella koreensis]NUZ05063.1 PAS domain S-box protein [Schlegelella koreensis]